MSNCFNLFEQIQHTLLLKSKFICDFGLLNGKTGVAIAFAYLYKQTQNVIFDDCMGELLDEILERTYKGLDIDFESGFAGIGWGMEYLIQNGFVEGDGVEVCGDLDLKIMERDPRRMTDLSLESGLEGLLHYIIMHLHGAIQKGSPLPFDDIYLQDLYFSVRSTQKCNPSPSLHFLINKYVNWYNQKKDLEYQSDIAPFIKSADIGEIRCSEYSLGIRDGLSGVLLKQLL